MNENTAINPENTPTLTEREAEAAAKEEIVGEHDIVIEEDFDINLDVAEVSKDTYLDASKPDENATDNDNDAPIGTEQSGNITF